MGESDSTEKKDYDFRGLMRSFFNNIQPLIILILIIIIILLQTCGGKKVNKVCPDVQGTKTEVVIDTVEIEIEKKVKVPVWRTKVDTVFQVDTHYVDVIQKVDTLSIIRDYYQTYLYVDTLNLDTLGYIIVKDYIGQNIILDRGFSTNLTIPKTTITNTEYLNTYEFYTGMNASFNRSNIGFMGVEGILRNKRGNLFTLGIGVNRQQEPMLSTGIYWQIWKKD